MIFDYDHINEYQLSITNYCNAACPQCPRNISGGPVNPYLPLQHLSRQIIDQVFETDLVSRLTQIFFCGAYGEPTIHPEFLDILRDFRKKRSNLWIYIHSNGGTHDADWWQELAEIIGKNGKIDFGIDGLEDTNHIYRRHIKWSTLMTNVKSFIDGGGCAQWNYIVFRHNQHQIDRARSLSKQLGFDKFVVRRTGRFFDAKNIKSISLWPVLDKTNNVDYYLEPSDMEFAQNPSVQRIDLIKTQPGGWKHYHDTTKIHCDALQGRKVVITADGLVLPCNFFEHNLYDARYHDSTFMPGSNDLCRDKQGRNQIQKLIESVGRHTIDIHHRTLREVFTSDFWHTVVDSWNLTLDQGRIYECANTCGEKFTKVWDQGA